MDPYDCRHSCDHPMSVKLTDLNLSFTNEDLYITEQLIRWANTTTSFNSIVILFEVSNIINNYHHQMHHGLTSFEHRLLVWQES